MIPDKTRDKLVRMIERSEHPKEQIINVMYNIQKHYGYLSDEAVFEAAGLLEMTPLEVEELATFYDFIYREPVGKYVIHACDGAVCWMFGETSVVDYLCRKLDVRAGEITKDGMFTVLPSACIGFCDQAPAILVNGSPYGRLNPEKIDNTLERLRKNHGKPVYDR